MCQCAMQLGAVILLSSARGITADNRVALCHINFFAILVKARAKLQPQLTGLALLLWDLPKFIGLAHRGWTSPSSGYCWGQAFDSVWRVPATIPASRAFGSWHFRLLKKSICRVLQEEKEHLSSFAGSRRCLRSSCGGNDWPTRRRPRARGITSVIKWRLSCQRMHVAVPHWSVKKWPYNVIVWISPDCVLYWWGR
jgi:hypothetical protein